MNLIIPQKVISNTVDCSENFACLTNSDSCLCKVNDAAAFRGRTVWFLELSFRAPILCPYKVDFGDSHFCACPTRIEIYQRYGK